VALDAALISTMYRRLRCDEVQHWTSAVVRRTWLPAAALLLFMAALGFALQHLAPNARSIGAAVRAIVS
jgi:hypothetical protein